MAIFTRRRKCDGVVTYNIRFKAYGKRRPVECAGTTKDQARRLLAKRMGEVASGTWVDPRLPQATFKDFAETFLKDHPGKRRSNHYAVNVAELVKEFGDRLLCEITRGDLDAYRVKLETTARPGRPIPKRKRVEGGPTRTMLPPLSSTTVLKRLRVAHRMFHLAVRWDVLKVNPTAGLDKPSPRGGRTRYLTPDEFETLQAASSPWVRSMQRLAVCTGMRLKEIATLTWEAVDEAGGTLRVDEDTKTGGRNVPVGGAALAILKQRREARKEVGKLAGKISPFVFTTDKGDDYTSDEQRRLISDATRRGARSAGIGTGLGFHVLRHTAASWMVQAGVPLYEVQRVLGHSTPVLTMRYAHLAPDHLKTAVSALDRALGVAMDTQAATQESGAAAQGV
jgi:integrase